MFGGYFQTDILTGTPRQSSGAHPPSRELRCTVAVSAGRVREPVHASEHVYSVFGSLNWSVTSVFDLNAGIRGSWVNNDFTGNVPIVQ